MSILSGEPIVLIGPGSEWFWSMAQFVIVAVTLLGIYYQFRLQRAANAFEQLNDLTAEWSSERLVRAKLRYARAIHSGTAPSAGSAGLVADFGEKVASLVRGGHIDVRVIYEQLGGALRYWWFLLQDETHRSRAMYGSTTWVHFEWLAAEVERLAALDGDTAPLTRDRLPVIIADYEDQIQMAEESRTAPARVARKPAC